MQVHEHRNEHAHYTATGTLRNIGRSGIRSNNRRTHTAGMVHVI